MASEQILLVDDDESMLRVVEKILKKAGREVICARDGREAIEQARIHSFDLFICDVRMPGMDGIEAISQIKQSHPNSRCIVITGYADEAASIRAIRLGVDDYLKKPFKMEEFLRSVERSMELARDARAREERLQSMRENYLSVIQRMAEAFEDRDAFRAGHSKRVAGYARMLGEALGFSAERLDLLDLAAGLEDVGLLGVREEILNKVSPLGAAERKHIESHTSTSHTLLAPLTDLERVLPMILYHHEHFDGSGYPEGLATHTATTRKIGRTASASRLPRPWGSCERGQGGNLIPNWWTSFKRSFQILTSLVS
ncbi:MAG: response regulator [Armatimonadetes bacterium]|nr:response regulator [Armatimonadota bacterium]